MPDLLPPDQGAVTEETEDEATKARSGKRKAEGSPGMWFRIIDFASCLLIAC